MFEKKKKIWNNLDLMETLIDLAYDEKVEPIIRQLLDLPQKHFPELTILSLIQIKVIFFFFFSYFFFLSFSNHFLTFKNKKNKRENVDFHYLDYIIKLLDI